MRVPAEQVTEALREPAVFSERRVERRPRPDRGLMQRVPALVEQLLEVAQSSRRVRGEDPRRGRLPDAVAPIRPMLLPMVNAVAIGGRPGAG